ncbi:hypothetical protein F5878DRAFT_674679 [Lentinula raphanica]|uniref:Uncharacterized protein n=1 Tax=Lentinula raphanica TaxID=153919 RepID=A0AA38NVQ5_9AGAR|nr:hypothetical protein F5878DRAFT_674679 [Lentinula raphanica]
MVRKIIPTGLSTSRPRLYNWRRKKEKENARLRRADLYEASIPTREASQGQETSEASTHLGLHVSLILDADRAGPKPVAVRSQSNRVTFADGLNTRILVHHHSTSALGSTRERAYDDEDGGFAKKTRLENDELIDGDEEADSRGSKRGLGDEANEDRVLRTLRGKRQRKKRDWDEAGSTYGGGLEEQDEEAKFSVEEDKAHRKKRRTKRRSDANTISRGKKRDRDLEDDLGASDGKGNLTLPANSQEDERQAGNKQYEEGSKPSPSLAPIFGSAINYVEESENKSAFTFGSSSSAAPASSTPTAASDKANSAFYFGVALRLREHLLKQPSHLVQLLHRLAPITPQEVPLRSGRHELDIRWRFLDTFRDLVWQ